MTDAAPDMSASPAQARTERFSVYLQDADFVAGPMVSVLMWTYNDRPHIERAIESVLAQNLQSSYELVISDDCSTDGTTEILKNYQKRYPEKIRLILSTRNIWKDGDITGRLLRQARGKYVALHHGDDEWTDPRKLQMQVECLEKDARLSLVYHNVEYRYEGEEGNNTLAFPAAGRSGTLPPPPSATTFRDLLKGRVIPTLSVMYRAAFLEECPEWISEMAVGDWPIFLLLLRRGPGLYLDRVMGVYRQHAGGGWSSLGQVRMTQAYLKTARALANHIPMGEEDRREFHHGTWIRVLHCVEKQLQEHQPGPALSVLLEHARRFPRQALANAYGYRLAAKALGQAVGVFR